MLDKYIIKGFSIKEELVRFSTAGLPELLLYFYSEMQKKHLLVYTWMKNLLSISRVGLEAWKGLSKRQKSYLMKSVLKKLLKQFLG